MKKEYYVIPATNIFNDSALVGRLKTPYTKYSQAVEVAAALAREYNVSFNILTNVCSIKSEIITTLVED